MALPAHGGEDLGRPIALAAGVRESTSSQVSATVTQGGR